MESILETVKALLNIEDDSKDTILEYYIEDATNFILNEGFHDEVPHSLRSTLVKMVIYDYEKKIYRKNGVLKNKTEGDMSESYVTEYPKEILQQIQRRRRVRVV
ncbi:phage head-tail connector protein [Bacillus sp. JJ1532]|uniref:phage head-tail connector protein n=1 Tax=Bacillus sp. JJ1532 TaxID=3122958 RepID=UPI0030005605